ncbi:hypothetical protein BDN71DRAFT_1514138 [Pleurotus eryngii]|uniref:Uncharacterized protein n=1 Tax=Pleurotus eryngii TaxID=5323 RepID=A0A9P5ZHI0_PLEER|nr:hypothetical protein BDN71DRAFT_1514138 [Pleurotus eryngii]
MPNPNEIELRSLSGSGFVFSTTLATVELKLSLLNTFLPMQCSPAKVVIVGAGLAHGPILMIGMVDSSSPIFALSLHHCQLKDVGFNTMTRSLSSECIVDVPFGSDASRSLCGIQLPTYIYFNVTFQREEDYHALRHYLCSPPSIRLGAPGNGDPLVNAFAQFAQFGQPTGHGSYFDARVLVYFTTIRSQSDSDVLLPTLRPLSSAKALSLNEAPFELLSGWLSRSASYSPSDMCRGPGMRKPLHHHDVDHAMEMIIYSNGVSPRDIRTTSINTCFHMFADKAYSIHIKGPSEIALAGVKLSQTIPVYVVASFPDFSDFTDVRNSDEITGHWPGRTGSPDPCSVPSSSAVLENCPGHAKVASTTTKKRGTVDVGPTSTSKRVKTGKKEAASTMTKQRVAKRSGAVDVEPASTSKRVGTEKEEA